MTFYAKEKVILNPHEEQIIRVKPLESKFKLPESAVLIYEKHPDKDFNAICGATDSYTVTGRVIVQNNTNHKIVIQKNERVMSVKNYENAMISDIPSRKGKIALTNN